jgi:hypothetical protein
MWLTDLTNRCGLLSSDGYVQEQTMISQQWSETILNRVRPALIINGHDHCGCFYQHNNHTAEYTIRSMMGDFQGHSALLEIKQLDTADAGAEADTTASSTVHHKYEYNIIQCPFISMRDALILWIYCVCVLVVLVLIAIMRILCDCSIMSTQHHDLTDYQAKKMH